MSEGFEGWSPFLGMMVSPQVGGGVEIITCDDAGAETGRVVLTRKQLVAIGVLYARLGLVSEVETGRIKAEVNHVLGRAREAVLMVLEDVK